MNDLQSLQFALDMQVNYIENVYSLHGNIPLSMEMRANLGMALTDIIEQEIKRLKKHMLDQIYADINGFEKQA